MQPGSGDTARSSFYAAGIGVMFLLFSCAGAGGTLLEEEETGTLGPPDQIARGHDRRARRQMALHRDDGDRCSSR